MSKDESRRRRKRSVFQAVGTSLISKGSSSVLQFISLPLAARVLGREEFGIYATISVSLYAVTMLQIGVGPALARGIAEAVARSDRERERRLYQTGAAMVIALSMVAVVAVGLVISAVPVATLFGAAYAKWESVLMPALWTGVVLLAVDLIARHTDRVREGYMEAAVANAWVAAGNLIGAVVVFAGIHFFPSPRFILLAVFLPNILMRLTNTVFLLRKRPWLVRPLCRPERKEAVEMLKDGLFFAATTSVVTLVEIKLCGLLIGRMLGPADVAIHFVLMSITTAFSGMLIMVGTPLWAAIVDARAKGDRDWLAAATRRYYQYLALMAAMASVTLVGFGPLLVPLLYGEEFSAGRLLFSGHALFLFAIGWRHVNRYVAIGLDSLPATVAPILVGLGVGFCIGVFGLKIYGLWALYAGLAVGTLAVAGVVLPRLVWRKIHSATEPAGPSAASASQVSSRTATGNESPCGTTAEKVAG